MRSKGTYDRFDMRNKSSHSLQEPSSRPASQLSTQPEYDKFDFAEERYGDTGILSSKDFITGMFFGMIVGAAAALLSTPKSGTEMRGTLKSVQTGPLKEKASSLKDTAKDKTSTIVDKVKSMKSSSDDSEESGVDSEKVDEKKEQVKSAVDTAAETVKDKVDTHADTAKEKLDQTKKAMDQAENKANSSSGGSSSNGSSASGNASSATSVTPVSPGNSSNTAPPVYTDPVDRGVDESKKDGGPGVKNMNNTTKKQNKNNR